MGKSTFAERLKEIMKQKGVKQSDIVAETKIPKSAISQYLSGKFEAKQDRIYILAQYFGVSEAWLMGYDVPKTMDIYVFSHVTEKQKLDEYIAILYLPSDPRKEIAKRIISKTKKLSVEGLKKLEERIDELLLIGGEYVSDDDTNPKEKIIVISKKKLTRKKRQTKNNK